MTRYAELCAISNFSFLHGASHPDEMVFQAQKLGAEAIAITDVNTLAGIVRAHNAAKNAGMRYIVGARLRFGDGTPDTLCYPSDRLAYGKLCRLLTRGKLRAPKGACALAFEDLLEYGEGQLFALLSGESGDARMAASLDRFQDAFPGAVWLAASRRFRPDDRKRLNRLSEIAAHAGAPLLAVGDALYHSPERRALQDTLYCIREHCTIDQAGRTLEAHAERSLKSSVEMAHLFCDHPDALAQTLRLIERTGFSLDELRYEYPDETSGESETPQAELARLTWLGAQQRYPGRIPEKVRQQISYELDLIDSLSYAPYFLTVYDVVRYAREREILCQGRGSAANSAVCFCLGITSVDPERVSLLFERFISAERNEPPDIDVDFEHERREEVIQYIYDKYGRDRAGIAAAVITYRSRSALREVGKAMGLTSDVTEALAGSVWGRASSGVGAGQVEEAGVHAYDPRIRRTLALAAELTGFPRHLSQHTGGFVITRGPLNEVIPVGNAAMKHRTFVEWDKDDLDALGMIKVDVLALGMLTCISKALVMLKSHYAVDFELATIPAEEPAVYDMICNADTLGVFQIESRAQMTMLPRLKPRSFYDLVIEVAIVRPGPIQGDMVHPYLRRRDGAEKPRFPSKELEEVLAKTLGVPLFQEQAMQIAIVAAGFTPSEADGLRRAMATFRRAGTIHSYRDKMVEGMVVRGYDRDFAERCFKQIEGFGEYGFPESHAASFALLVYASCWLKRHYPDVFCAALINSQPMGFYAPAQIVRDAREHGVRILPVDVNRSSWDLTLEPCDGLGEVHPRFAAMQKGIHTRYAVRLGFRQIKGFSETDARAIEANRANGYDSVRDLCWRSRIGATALERLANADGFGSVGLSRRDALWAVRGIDAAGLADRDDLFSRSEDLQREEEMSLPKMPLGEEVAYDYKTLRLSLKSHPVQFLRAHLHQGGYLKSEEIGEARNGAYISVCGLVLIRQRPGTAKGVIFLTLEDETGVANVIVWPKVFERYRKALLAARLLGVEGTLQREGEVIHLVARRLFNLTERLAALSEFHAEMDEALARADEVKRPVDEELPRNAARRAREVTERMRRILPDGRNFH